MIRDLSKYARRVVLGAMTALALFAGSANINQVQAADGASDIGELGIDRGRIGDYAKGVAVGYIVKKLVYDFGYKSVRDCWNRDHGLLGEWLGAGPAPAGQENLKCNVATVASKVELQADRFAMFGIDPAKAAFTAQATDLRAVQHASLVASFNQAMSGNQYAAVR